MAPTYLTVRVGFGLRDPGGTQVPAKVRFVPEVPLSCGTVTIGPVERTVGADGVLGGTVAATDDAATTPAGRPYRIEVIPRSADPWSFWAVLPHAAPGGEVDLMTLAQLTDPPARVAPISTIRGATDYDDTVAPLDGQVPAWDAVAQRFRPATPGGGGAVTSAPAVTLARTAPSTALSGHRVVLPTSATVVDYASAAVAGHAGAPLWLTLGAAAAGAAVQVLAYGPVVEPSWSWTAGPVYLGTAGMLTQTVPTAPGAAFLTRLGWAVDATTVLFDPQPPVRLT